MEFSTLACVLVTDRVQILEHLECGFGGGGNSACHLCLQLSPDDVAVIFIIVTDPNIKSLISSRKADSYNGY